MAQRRCPDDADDDAAEEDVGGADGAQDGPAKLEIRRNYGYGFGSRHDGSGRGTRLAMAGFRVAMTVPGVVRLIMGHGRMPQTQAASQRRMHESDAHGSSLREGLPSPA